ncbi:hypothetical protein P168DRAFT_293181 [Aspergillus campestris IBT 28561]|uniref:Isochorismatase family protein family n=1 Tax=Aspergillus campestris (strain IBT 28561) TaxID=1392248 RepID=A0A2I1CT12_ASPC2|nr:uncharacterized protein P168DRAFT_293181 [Aspergillus campestris IBT 28561]PKY00754.1 hypothetical protein P168DRAFT_293181 [Aspergillus campestris IBT 28561]
MSFPSFGNLPAIHTRKALLLLDLQNDFVRPSGALHVPNTSDFLDSLAPLTTAFRRNGDVVWVRSHQADRRSLIGLDAQELVVLDRPAKKATDPPSEPPSDPGPIQPITPLDEEAFLSVDPPRCCYPHTAGAQFPAPVLSAVDPSDTLIDKSDYSALQDQGLILSFRTRFVTEIYLCGSLSNVSVYATALDAVRLGFSVTVVEDCLGFRSFQRHEEAMRRMADILGANGISVQELLEELDWEETDAIARKGDPQPARWVTPTGIETVMDELNVRRNRKAARDSAEGSGSGQQRMVQDLLADASDDEDGNLLELANLVRASGRHRRPEQPPGSPEKKSHARARRPRRQHDVKPDGKSEGKSDSGPRSSYRRPSAPNKMPEVCRPGDRIGEGDSRILYELDLPPEAFEQIRDEVAWQKMYHLSGEVPRLVAVQGRPQPDGSIPIYRHPADESPPLLPFTRTVNEVRVFVERILGHPLNHVLIQLYRGGDDRISEHSDKTLDIARGSLICNVSLGCQRTMVLRTKSHETDGESGRVTQRIPLPHESLFILGEQTNRRWLHGIRPDKRPEKEKSLDERAFGGQRISLTFRRIATFVNAQGDMIWGQGAVSKEQGLGRPVIHGDPAETERLIRAFGEENRSVDLDWDKVYGGGFDAVNFVTSSTAMLSLGTDDIASLRVRLALDENGVRYDMPDTSKTPSHAQPLFTASDGTEVSGDVNILTYLARTPPRPGVAALQGGDQLDKIDQLLASWDQYQAHDGTPGDLSECLEKWDKTLAGQAYLCGPALGIDDCALWPILREMVVQGVVSTKTHRNVAGYYQRVEKRSIVKKVLET